MFVGDRSGTVFRVGSSAHAVPFASLPPSLAAFHLAMGPDDALYVTAPTMATYDHVYRVDRLGAVSVVSSEFGRPQGLAIDEAGTLYVVDALAGGAGLYRCARARRASWSWPPRPWWAWRSTRAAGWWWPPTTRSTVSTTGCGPGELDEAVVRHQVARPPHERYQGPRAPVAALARGSPADGARHRGNHRRRHLLVGRVGGGGRLGPRRRGARRRAVLRPDGRRLRVCRAVLCRVRRDGARLRLGVHLRVRHAGRGRRLDHRLGPDPRVRHRQRGGGRVLVGLLPGAAPGPRRCVARRGSAWTTGRRPRPRARWRPRRRPAAT